MAIHEAKQVNQCEGPILRQAQDIELTILNTDRNLIDPD